jgi:hypothetical protein
MSYTIVSGRRVIRDYRLIYSIEQFRVVIVALVHRARDLKALWEKENRG